MTALRDHLSRAGRRVTEDTLKPFTPDQVGPTSASGPPPGFSAKPPKGHDGVAVGMKRQETPLIVSVVVSSGCYRHPDEE